MQQFKVGDYVRLTGEGWGDGSGPEKGTVHSVKSTDVDGWAEIHAGWHVNPDPDGLYAGTIVPTEEGLRYQALQVTEDPEKVQEIISSVQDKPPQGSEDAVHPSHYKFPGGVSTIDIARHLGFLEGNVVKYVTRAGCKGDRLEDLLKAKRYLDWAIEDAEKL